MLMSTWKFEHLRQKNVFRKSLIHYIFKWNCTQTCSFLVKFDFIFSMITTNILYIHTDIYAHEDIRTLFTSSSAMKIFQREMKKYINWTKNSHKAIKTISPRTKNTHISLYLFDMEKSSILLSPLHELLVCIIYIIYYGSRHFLVLKLTMMLVS